MFSVKWSPICRHWLFNFLINGIKILFLFPTLTTVPSCFVTVSTVPDFPQPHTPQHSGYWVWKTHTYSKSPPSLMQGKLCGRVGLPAPLLIDTLKYRLELTEPKLLQSIQPAGRGCRHSPALEFSCQKISQAKCIPSKPWLQQNRRTNLRWQCHYSLFNSAT